ncbi:MAG: DUF4837 family protein [Candidatus Latescibacteria bacterium]|jgi:hypothetical protein|nr:DUF4837 family protein [Candidatus Latescibacterota bacterium]
MKYFPFILLLCLGCDDRLPESLGPARKLIVLADSTDWQTLEDPIREIFETVISTPQAERVYEIEHGDVNFFQSHKHVLRKNLLVIAPLNANHPTAQFLKEILSTDVQQAIQKGRSAVSWKHDIWARDQTLLVVSGTDLDTVIENLWMESDRLYRTLENSVDKSIRENIYSFGEREDVTRELATTYGWSVRVPFGFRILEAYPDSGFVVLAKDNPSRWLSIYWESDVHPDQLTEDWCIEKRDQITDRLFGGDRIVPGEVTIRQTEFTGKLAIVLQGLWENEAEWKGGPFKSYAFVDVDLNRFFFIDMGLYAPNKKKAPYLRQVDLVAKSFTIHADFFYE